MNVCSSHVLCTCLFEGLQYSSRSCFPICFTFLSPFYGIVHQTDLKLGALRAQAQFGQRSEPKIVPVSPAGGVRGGRCTQLPPPFGGFWVARMFACACFQLSDMSVLCINPCQCWNVFFPHVNFSFWSFPKLPHVGFTCPLGHSVFCHIWFSVLVFRESRMWFYRTVTCLDLIVPVFLLLRSYS